MPCLHPKSLQILGNLRMSSMGAMTAQHMQIDNKFKNNHQSENICTVNKKIKMLKKVQQVAQMTK